MSRQEQNDRHIIWSDISLDLDDWRESLEELYPGYSDDELYDIMVKSNAENLYDERVICTPKTKPIACRGKPW